VSQLYLAESRPKRNQLWARVHKAMQRLKVNQTIIEHIMNKKDVVILAKNLEDWLDASKS
jgi:hypothetical protein